jgi:hypothetical protein
VRIVSLTQDGKAPTILFDRRGYASSGLSLSPGELPFETLHPRIVAIEDVLHDEMPRCEDAIRQYDREDDSVRMAFILKAI